MEDKALKFYVNGYCFKEHEVLVTVLTIIACLTMLYLYYRLFKYSMFKYQDIKAWKENQPGIQTYNILSLAVVRFAQLAMLVNFIVELLMLFRFALFDNWSTAQGLNEREKAGENVFQSLNQGGQYTTLKLFSNARYFAFTLILITQIFEWIVMYNIIVN